jgi:hypothetical protein
MKEGELMKTIDMTNMVEFRAMMEFIPEMMKGPKYQVYTD